MKIHHIVLVTGLLLVAGSTTLQAKDSSWVLRVHGAIVESAAGEKSSAGAGLSSSIDAGGGLGIGAEFRLNSRLGLEVSLMYAGLQFESSLSSRAVGYHTSTSSMMPLTFAVPIHLSAGRPVDFYVAPTFSLVRYADVETTVSATTVGSRVDVDSDAALGVALGLDVPFGKGKWAFSTSLRYMRTSAVEIDIDPVIVTLGVACRF